MLVLLLWVLFCGLHISVNHTIDARTFEVRNLCDCFACLVLDDEDNINVPAGYDQSHGGQ